MCVRPFGKLSGHSRSVIQRDSKPRPGRNQDLATDNLGSQRRRRSNDATTNKESPNPERNSKRADRSQSWRSLLTHLASFAGRRPRIHFRHPKKLPGPVQRIVLLAPMREKSHAIGSRRAQFVGDNAACCNKVESYNRCVFPHSVTSLVTGPGEYSLATLLTPPVNIRARPLITVFPPSRRPSWPDSWNPTL